MLATLAAGWLWLMPRAGREADLHVAFVERSAEAGCENTHSKVQLADVFDNIMPWLSSVGAAAAAGDFDGDGFADVYVTNSGRGDCNRLFRNRGDGTFEDVTQRAGVGCCNPEGAAMHAVWGDVNNNGRLDLYVVKWAEPNQLFINNGDGTFEDVSSAAGVDYWGYGNGATFLDYDRDGRLDLVVGNYFAERVVDPRTGERVRNNLWDPVTTRVMHETFTHADNGGRNVLYRNVTEDGRVRFEDVTESVGLKFTGWTLSVGSGDLNNDGWPDLYLANDFGPDEFYLNTGAAEFPPRFRLVVDPRGHPGIGNDWWKGMNVDMGDVNNDGYLDVYVTNILQRNYKTDEGNMLWLNTPDPVFPGGRGFVNVAEKSSTHDGGWGWGGKFADFNNDGLLDIYTVNGFVTGDENRNYWFAIQEMVTQTKNQTVDAADWPVMGTRDLSGRERGRLFMQIPAQRASTRAELRHSEDPPDQSNSPSDHRSLPVFAEMAERAGISDLFNGRGIAVADFNHSGYLDMYIANQGAPATYYVNITGRPAVAPGRDVVGGDSPAMNGGAREENGGGRTGDVGARPGNGGGRTDPSFLWMKLVGRPDRPVRLGARSLASTTDAVGARVTVQTTHGLQIREVQGGMGFASQSEHAVHFGIPEPESIRQIEIRWPSGRVQVYEGEKARALVGRHMTIVESVEDETS